MTLEELGVTFMFNSLRRLGMTVTYEDVANLDDSISDLPKLLLLTEYAINNEYKSACDFMDNCKSLGIDIVKCADYLDKAIASNRLDYWAVVYKVNHETMPDNVWGAIALESLLISIQLSMGKRASVVLFTVKDKWEDAIDKLPTLLEYIKELEIPVS